MNICFGGSRSLPWSVEIHGIIRDVLAEGHQIHVGCAVGADAQIINACLAQHAADQLSVFCAFGQSGAGSWSGSAVTACRQAAAAGARVAWLAGGSLAVPLVARLACRSRAALVGSSVLVLFLFTPGSRGSLTTAAAAVAGGLQVFAFCQSRPVPLPPAGSWSRSSFAGRACWQWQPAQIQLF